MSAQATAENQNDGGVQNVPLKHLQTVSTVCPHLCVIQWSPEMSVVRSSLQALLLLGSFPFASATGWDDFSNNLATDLAPFLALFGEQITKQYLSESVTFLDYFIFAMAPMGILTALVSAIRVCGSPSLRAFIGRAQEGSGVAEAELCSSTSRDVCELYNNGGIARVFGRPKILEIIHDPAKADFSDGTAGIYTFREYLDRKDQDEWVGSSSEEDAEAVPDAFAPNLSLNVGIKRQHQAVFWVAALFGFASQSAVVAFALVATYLFKWDKEDSPPEAYACPMAVTGTLVVCGGVFICAYMIGSSAHEQIFYKKQRNSAYGQRQTQHSSIYWVQPGAQVLGDQVFDPFCCSDKKQPLQEYITSRKSRRRGSSFMVWVAVGTTIVGFVMQFVGLRGIHSSIAVLQLGVTLLMSGIRASLRMRRLKPEDNYLAKCPDEVVGHELDWLALRLGVDDVRKLNDEDKIEPQNYLLTTALKSTKHERRDRWRFLGVADSPKILQAPSSEGLNAAERILAYRTRLAQLTQVPLNHTKLTASAGQFDVGMVEVRAVAQRLAKAIEIAANSTMLKASKIRDDWHQRQSMYWAIDCQIASRFSKVMNLHFDTETPYKIHIELTRQTLEDAWKLKNELQLEGLLGLWMWSFLSDPDLEISDLHTGFTLSLARQIPNRRIVTANRNVAETDLQLWLSGEGMSFTEETIRRPSSRGHPAMLWLREEENKSNRQWCDSAPGSTQYKENLLHRFFGWYSIGNMSHLDEGKSLTVWAARTSSPLLSLCAQEVFASFIKSITDIVEDVGSIDIRPDTGRFRLENSLVSEFVEIFMENHLGPRDEALLCVVSSMISRPQLRSFQVTFEAARSSAIAYRRQGDWAQAERVLRWIWGLCRDTRSLDTAEGEPILRAAAVALGELYRWSLRQEDKRQFGIGGIRWLTDQKSVAGLPMEVVEIIDRYSDIYHGFSKARGRENLDHELMSAVESSLTDTLVCLVLCSDSCEYKEAALCRAAAKRGWDEVVLALLEMGAVVDGHKNDTKSPLIYAAECGNASIAKALLDWKASPNYRDSIHRTPLYYASDSGHTEVVQMLLQDTGCDPDATDIGGRTPFLIAAWKGYEEIVKLLIDTGRVDINTKDNLGQTPMLCALSGAQEGVVRILLDKADLNTQTVYGDGPLTLAAATGNDKIFKLLLSTGKVDPIASNRAEKTPLQIAVAKGHAAIVKLLLPQVAEDPETVSGKGLLVTAAKHGHEEILELLLSTDTYSKHPEEKLVGHIEFALFAAASRGELSMVKHLLDSTQADPKARNGFDQTPLILAAEGGHTKLIEFLLSLDVGNSHVADEYGSALRAASAGYKAIVDLLLNTGRVDPDSKGEQLQTALHIASQHGSGAIVELLLTTGKVEPDSKNEDGATPLALASAKGHADVVKLLLETEGVDPAARNKDGETPLWNAAAGGHDDVVKLLLDTNRVDPTAMARYKSTPLAQAALNMHIGVVRLLLTTGKCDVALRDDHGKTPVEHAKGQGSWEEDEGRRTIVELLEQELQSR